MSPEKIIYKLQKAIDIQLDSLTLVVTTGVDSMEKYRYILGQINALESVRQELSSLLNSEEKNEGTVININTKQ
jgi:hypothetical protein|tara:strand:+ start:99 stop:320 length:222 start_codon:yes stop_codon:yes gene_type:complete